MQQKTKALISYRVTLKLICTFVFSYAKSKFSHDEAHFRPDSEIFLSLISIQVFHRMICCGFLIELAWCGDPIYIY